MKPASAQATIAALAATTLALGGVYWLLRERDDRFASRAIAEG
jgi:hypothetical protein